MGTANTSRKIISTLQSSEMLQYRSKAMRALLIVSLLALTACQKMEAGEYGVKFTMLPVWMGGGVSDRVTVPGQTAYLFPWQTIYRVDTTTKVISWGDVGQETQSDTTDYVEARAADGNEVGLAISVRYHVDPEKVAHVIQKVGDQEQIRNLVAAVARADIRTHMNTLNTKDFFSRNERSQAVGEVRDAMASRLGPEGIIVDAVIYQDHRFERTLGEGIEPDRRYQEQIDLTQAKFQETQQEEKRRAAIIQQKGTEREQVQAQVNRMVQTAKGYKRQASVRGNSYLIKKTNEAAQITAAGLNEVEGMKKRIEALSGKGGEALLRLEIAKALAARKPKFVLMNSTKGGQGELGITKVDTNELLRQAGMFAAAQEGLKDSKTPEKKNDSSSGAAAE